MRKVLIDTAYGPLAPEMSAQNLRNRVAYTMFFGSYADINNVTPNEATATYYSYDILGNVDTLIQDYRSGVMNSTNNRFKKIVYDYDLQSGKVDKVAYQHGYYLRLDGTDPDEPYARYIHPRTIWLAIVIAAVITAMAAVIVVVIRPMMIVINNKIDESSTTFTSVPMKVAGIWWINYTYRINGQVYNETRSINKTQLGPAPFYMVGRQFPIIYNPQHLENSKLLVIPGDFNELGIPYPDSLNWVKL